MEDLKDYKEHIQFCEYCGNIITDDGRCPDPECVHNLLMDVLGELDENKQENIAPVAEDTTTKTDDTEQVEENIDTKPATAGQDDSQKDEKGAK